MTDFVQAILTGLFTGLGVGVANYLHEKYIRDKLDSYSDKLKRLTEVLKNGIKE